MLFVAAVVTPSEVEILLRTHPVRVAIDLETTGLHPEQDAVIEIGALKFAGEDVLETFESFVATTTLLPYRIQRLTGITPAQLRGAPTMNDLLPRLRTFLGDYPLVGHSVAFDAAFLRRAGLARRNPLVDTYELASALLPGLSSYSLGAVGTALGVSSPTYHRALADAQLSRDVFLALLQRLEDLDQNVLEALGHLAAPPDWTPGYLVRSVLRANRNAAAGAAVPGSGTTLGDLLAAKLGMDPSVLSLAVSAGTARPEAAHSRLSAVVAAPLTADAAGTDMPAPSSSASAAQRAISASVGACFAASDTLVVEVASDMASLRACLTPALRWAAEQAGRVLISASDGERAAQIARQVIPSALAGMSLDGEQVPIAEIGEHETYLCLHRWFGAARESRNGLLGREMARGLAKMTVWAGQTQTGSRIEMALAGPEQLAWERARAGSEFADSGDTCTYRRDGYCFVTRAKTAATDARVVVTTHAALAAQLAGNDVMLPATTRVIVLDGHLFEEELRRARTWTLDRQDLLAKLATLAEVEAGGRRSGLLHLAAARVEHPGAVTASAQEQAWFAPVERARRSAETFFRALRRVLQDAQGDAGEGGSGFGEAPEQRTLRLDAQIRQRAAWQEAARGWVTLEERLRAVAKLAREVSRAVVAARGSKATLASDGVATDLVASARVFERLCAQGATLFGGGTEDRVHWLRVPYAPSTSGNDARRPGQRAQASRRQGGGGNSGRAGIRNGAEPQVATDRDSSGASGDTGALLAPRDESADVPAVYSAPLQVGPLLAPLWTPGHALVLAGSSLSVAGDFSYIRGSLGLPESAQTLGPAVDRAEQTLLCLPADVPEPNAPQYQRHLDEALVSLATSLGGRLVAIFPSHAALRASAQTIRRSLERHDILVLAQGQDGSARQLWQTFRNEPRVVLLGAGSFWEGAEQTDAPPACVVVTRVPFPALSDPLLAARAEMWPDPQNQFVVPHAALRVRQALGGLAWSHTQRNAVVLFDRRIQTRGYGSTILGTLPRCTQYQEAMAHISERVAEWVGD